MKLFYNLSYLLTLFLLISSQFIFAQGRSKNHTQKGIVKEKVLSHQPEGLYYKSTPSRVSKDAKFFDDFDSHEDFSLEFGEWTLVDVDKDITYSYSIDFPHEEEPVAYMVMNPLEVTPPATFWEAHSGGKFLVTLSCYNEVNDDWMITPEILAGNHDVFSFWAKSQSSGYGLERFQVWINTTGSDNPEDFTMISEGEYIKAPAIAWKKYQYDLDAYAGQTVRLAIRCVSAYATFFMVDDVMIAPVPDVPSCDLNYRVWDADTIRTGTIKETDLVFSIANTEGGILEVSEITDLSSTNFTTTLNPSEVHVPRNGQYEFGFNYHPEEAGRDSVAFVIHSNAYGGQTDTIFLVGQAYDLPDGTLEIGMSKETHVKCPIANYYQYSISQTIYTKEELQDSDGKILERIQLRYKGDDPSYNKIKVYLTQEDKDEFDSNVDWVDIEEEDLYYDNMIALPHGDTWITINLERPFEYDANKDLVVTFKEESDYFVPYRLKSNAFYVSPSLTPNGVDYKRMSMGKFSDFTNFDINNLPEASEVWEKRPNIRFFFGQSQVPKLIAGPYNLQWGFMPTGTTSTLEVNLMNSGNQTLQIFDIIIPEELPISFSETSMSIEPGMTKTIIATYAPTNEGPFSGTIEIESNSDEDASFVMYAEAYRSGYLYEDFEACNQFSWPPEGWTFKGNTGNWELGTFASNAYEKEKFAFSDPGDDFLVSPELYVRSGDKIVFHAKVFHGFSENTLFAYWSKDKIDWKPFPPIVLNNPSEHRYVRFEFDFPEPAEGNTYVAFRRGGDLGEVYLDQIMGPQIYLEGNDLKINDISGPELPVAGDDNKYMILVKNAGQNVISNYTVQLLDQNDEVLTTANGITVGSLSSQEVELNWIPEDLDATSVRAQVICDIDDDNENNFSVIFPVFVQKEYSVVNGLYPSLEKQGNHPVDVSEELSVSQTILLKEEISDGGFLSGFAFKNTFKNDFYEKRVFIYISETDADNLEEGWIPVENQKLVYDKRINYPRGVNTIYVPFNEPYLYTGKNLVVTTYRVKDNETLFQDSKFFGSWLSETPNRTRYYFGTSQGFDIDELDKYDNLSNFVPYTRLVFDIEECGSVDGQISLMDGGDAISFEDIKVSIPELGFEVMANEDGSFNYPFIPEGNHTVLLDAVTIETKEVEINVTAQEILDLDVTVTLRPMITIDGVVHPSFDESLFLEGAVITLSTDQLEYTALTDGNGNFLLDNILCNYTYTLNISQDGFDDYITEVEVENDNVNLGDVILNETAYPAILPIAEINEAEKVELRWYQPGNLSDQEFRYDDGTPRHHLGYFEKPNHLVGAAFKYGAFLKRVKWQLASSGIDHETCQIYILGLDVNGKPDRTQILYVSQIIPNIDDEWNTHELENPVWAPNGFFLGVNTKYQTVNLTADDGVEDPYEIVPGTMFCTPDWTDINTDWTELGAPDHFPYNFLIRAEGYSIVDLNDDEAKYQEKAKTGYSVYRGLAGTEDNYMNWDVLTPSSVSDTCLIDNGWSALPQGQYKYAVVTLYDNGITSEPAFSNIINKDMHASFHIDVDVNTTDDTPINTTITLTNHDGDIHHIYTHTIETSADNVSVTMKNLFKGIYSLRVEKAGFGLYTDDNIDMSTDDVSVEVLLEEVVNKPFNVRGTSLEGYKALVNWYDIDVPMPEYFEDFDSFTNDMGNWISLDLDHNANYHLTVCDFPGEGQSNGFFVFAPNDTDPSIFLTFPEFAPYRGGKYAIAFSSAEGQNNDWLISPDFTVGTGTIFSFHAKSAEDMYGKDRFRVLISESGSDNPNDFEVISEGDYMEVGRYYERYEYDLSEYAGKNIRVAIQCVSFQAVAFCVDQVYIGLKSQYQDKETKGYNLYVDDMSNPVATNLSTHSHMIEGLTHNQTYELGVSKVFSSGESEISTTNFVFKVVENVAPEIISSPVTLTAINEDYMYELVVEDYNNDELNFSLVNAPTWIELAQENDKYYITGTPQEYGDYDIEWEVTDGELSSSQAYTLKVDDVGIMEVREEAISIYPNPVKDHLYIFNAKGMRAEVMKLDGVAIQSFLIHSDEMKVNLQLESGSYLIKMSDDQNVVNKKLIVQ